jgi:hypothetical protein
MHAYDTGLRISTSQCQVADFVTIEPVEIKGREFPMDKNEILDSLKDPNLNAVRTTMNYKCQAWCLFSVVESDLVIHRLAVKDETHADEVLNNLFETITYTPKRQTCCVSLDWPEHEIDHWLFKFLIGTGWTTDGLIKDHYRAYGETWDGIKLERVFPS